jgi:hypothetical protein
MPIITMPTTSTPSPIVAAIQAAAQTRATVPTAVESLPKARTAETDEEVVSWIREHLAANPGAGKATMLKAFRAAGRKCNQTRFHGLVSRAQRPDSPKPVSEGSKVRRPPLRSGKGKAAANEAPVPSLDAAAAGWVGEGEPAKAEAPAEPKASKKAAKRSSKGRGSKAAAEPAPAPETVVELDADQPAQHQTF